VLLIELFIVRLPILVASGCFGSYKIDYSDKLR
jgi:hypothetical protein